jgi:hypothetical protein
MLRFALRYTFRISFIYLLVYNLAAYIILETIWLYSFHFFLVIRTNLLVQICTCYLVLMTRKKERAMEGAYVM